MIRLDKAVIVEGKYDKITLENIIDATIIPTDGFGIFKNKEKCDLIRMLSQKNGIIVMTDSDSAGEMIRAYLKKICKSEDIINVYIPQIMGKERRKTAFSAQKLLGVEGMSEDIILEALKRSNVTASKTNKPKSFVTKQDMFVLGLSGNENSSKKRRELARFIGLPAEVSSNSFLDAINAVYGREKFFERVEEWRQEEGKR